MRSVQLLQQFRGGPVPAPLRGDLAGPVPSKKNPRGMFRGPAAPVPPAWGAARPRPELFQKARGQAMVELTLVLVILLLLVFGAITTMQILMTQYTVAQATRAAAHQAALLGGPDGASGNLASAPGQVAEAARLILDGGMGTSASQATIAVTCRDASGQAVAQCRRYDAITVRIQYEDAPWAPIGPFDRVRADISATRAAERDQQ